MFFDNNGPIRNNSILKEKKNDRKKAYYLRDSAEEGRRWADFTEPARYFVVPAKGTPIPSFMCPFSSFCFLLLYF